MFPSTWIVWCYKTREQQGCCFKLFLFEESLHISILNFQLKILANNFRDFIHELNSLWKLFLLEKDLDLIKDTNWSYFDNAFRIIDVRNT